MKDDTMMVSTAYPVFVNGQAVMVDGELSTAEVLAMFALAGLRLRCDADSRLVAEPIKERGQ